MSKKNMNKDRFQAHLLDEETPFAIREAFNQLRTNLMYTVTENHRAPVFAVTSSFEGEGKSNVIANLAISFAQLNKRVLLIDGDMRCPTQHILFNKDRKLPGLSEIISGIEHNVILREVQPGLDLVLSGRIPPNPSELITSPRFSMILDTWSRDYDLIFIDLPPIGIVTDALAISKNISAYIFTVRSGRDSSKDLQNAVASMEHVGAKIAGVVLNDVNIKGSGRYQPGSRYSKYNYSSSRYETSAKMAKTQDKGEL